MTMTPGDHLDPFSLIAAHDGSHAFDAVVPPIVQTSLFTFSGYDEMLQTYRGETQRPVYSRGLNPTVRTFEEKLASLEGGEDGLAFSSGMAAISSIVMTLVSPGDRIVAVRHLYPDVFRLFETQLARIGITVSYVDGQDEAEVAAALKGAKLLYLESPTSWTMETHDVAALAALARAEGAVSVIDNSWASPIFQQPLALGVDLVLHSASKYLGGHSDVVAGVVAGSKALVDRIRLETLPYLGGKLGPFEAWLLVRGLRTLPIRMKAHEASGLVIARRLQAHDAIEQVLHPGLANNLPPGLSGTSGLFSFVFREGMDIRVFCDRLQYFKLGVSWGGYESLIVPGEIVLQQKARPNSAQAFGLNPRTVRLHVGLEGTEPLWRDLETALESACI